MELEKVPLSRLQPDPNNSRTTFTGIESLADSIDECGLLSPIFVIKEDEESGKYVIVTGERRYRALLILQERGSWDEEVFVLRLKEDSDGSFENLVENIQRQEVKSWQLGHRFRTLVDAGFTQTEIATRVGKTQGYVSRKVQISDGLAPEVIHYLNHTRNAVADNELIKATYLRTRLGDPDKGAQLNFVKGVPVKKGDRKRSPPKRLNAKGVFLRFKYLSNTYKPPVKYQEVIRQVVRYLAGKGNIDL